MGIRFFVGTEICQPVSLLLKKQRQQIHVLFPIKRHFPENISVKNQSAPLPSFPSAHKAIFTTDTRLSGPDKTCPFSP
jgi:hypothetical protein